MNNDIDLFSMTRHSIFEVNVLSRSTKSALLAAIPGSQRAMRDDAGFSVNVARCASDENEQLNQASSQRNDNSKQDIQSNLVMDQIQLPPHTQSFYEHHRVVLEHNYRPNPPPVDKEELVETGLTTTADFTANGCTGNPSPRYCFMQRPIELTTATFDTTFRYRFNDATGACNALTNVTNRDYKLAFRGISGRENSQPSGQSSKDDLEMERLNSAAKFLALVEQMGAMPYLANLDTVCTPFYISRKFETLTGFTSDQWCSNPDLRISHVHTDDRDNVLAAVHKTLSERGTFSLDYRLLTREGAIRWVHDEARVITNADGIPLFLQGVVLDISECKQAQQELERSHLELQKLIAGLDTLREKEQKRLAQEMHDDLGQLLAAMKIDLSTLAQRLPPNQPHIAEQVDTLNELVDAMVSSVRRIIADLPPKIMEDRGLFSALSVLATNFEKRHGIVTQFEVSQPEPLLEEHIATPIYRIVQEALNNVAKHADANHVAIRLDSHDHYLVLDVTDDGKGMGINELQKTDSFGLISMRERVKALGGEMKIDSNAGEGTAIRIAIPIEPSQTIC